MCWDEHKLYSEIYDLVIDSCTGVSPDCLALMRQALERETNQTARSLLQAMLENVELAGKLRKPVCQSPGFPTVYISFGDNFELPNIKDIWSRAITDATMDGFLRPSMVHPLTRENSGDNSGVGVPNFEFDYIPGQEYIEMVISFKGCGAELGNRMKIMTTAMLGKNYSGFKRLVLETVKDAGGKPCPPFAVGIGVGGQMDVAAKLSRRAVSTRDWRDVNPDPMLQDLEEELLEKINLLGIGPAGIGGDTTALAVKIGLSFTHTAILPVAINFHCWPARRGGFRIYPDGSKEVLFGGK